MDKKGRFPVSYSNLQEDKTYGNERGNDWFILWPNHKPKSS